MAPSLPPPAAPAADPYDAALPQTQCTRCGYPDCRSYAQALAAGSAAINRCPPGGAEGIRRLAVIAGTPPLPLDPERGVEGPRALAVIDEAWCIGCTLCIKACPVDCIVGASKAMHTVIDGWCTGCELCVPVCPVDCISMQAVTGTATGWDAWSAAQADTARARYAWHRERTERETREVDERMAARAQARLASADAGGADPAVLAAKRAVVAAALKRAGADPTDPAGATDPVDLADPTDPDPTGPADPADPTHPTGAGASVARHDDAA